MDNGVGDAEKPEPVAPFESRRDVIASIIEQAAKLVRAGFLSDGSSVMKTAIELIDVREHEADVVSIEEARRRT